MENTNWGVITTQGDSYIITWKIVTIDKWPDQFSIYGHSIFWEDVGIGDPNTDDGWTLIGNANQISAKLLQPETLTLTETVTGIVTNTETDTITTTVGGEITSTIFKTSLKSEAELTSLFLLSIISLNLLMVFRKIRFNK